MFIFNCKINKKLLTKFMFIFSFIIISFILVFTMYLIFIKMDDKMTVNDSIKKDDVFEITEKNYANILKASNDNIDSYIGLNVHLQGYVYRLINFSENQFVVARDMLISNDNQSLVIGFLSEYEKAKKFEDGTWVDVLGTIEKGDFSGPIAILKINSITQIEKPENPFVSMPDETYIPTSNMF